jgi:16S rRNA (cytidine1402-2'-O)-methyltransferase
MLYLIATPVGDNSEITLRSLKLLEKIETLIVESTKESSKLLRAHGMSGKKYFILDEHSKPEDILELAALCREQDVALLTDCGTPGFCDPGAHLVGECRRLGIPVKTCLGASALMGLLSLAGQRIDEFVFRGFIPAENTSRDKALAQLTRERRAIVLMDTPYRLKKLLFEMETFFSDRTFLLVLDLSQESEQIIEGSIQQLRAELKKDKAEFMLLIYPSKAIEKPNR